MQTAAWLVIAAQAYGGVGLLVATVFLLAGIERVDPASRGSVAFRPLLIPGIVLLWPLVVLRWLALARRASSAA